MGSFIHKRTHILIFLFISFQIFHSFTDNLHHAASSNSSSFPPSLLIFFLSLFFFSFFSTLAVMAFANPQNQSQLFQNNPHINLSNLCNALDGSAFPVAHAHPLQLHLLFNPFQLPTMRIGASSIFIPFFLLLSLLHHHPLLLFILFIIRLELLLLIYYQLYLYA